jgi:hypothetical protein
MSEGWCNEDYLVLFSAEDSEERSRQYKVSEYLPGYRAIGLKSWDDFIVMNDAGELFTVPTVPLVPRYLKPFSMPVLPALNADERFTGKIKWYIKPVVFGGDPNSGENVTWLNHEQHCLAVAWWNEQFRSHARWKEMPDFRVDEPTEGSSS